MHSWRRATQALKRETGALVLAYRDPRTPWFARIAVVCVVGYAFSPIDLIPDVIPILGLIDDFVLVPIGIWLALRLIPPEVMSDARQRIRSGESAGYEHPRLAAAVIIGLWIASVLLLAWLVVRHR